MNVLITGATGFVGNNLKEYLGYKCNVKGLSIRYNDGQKIKITNEAIVHLAGKSHDFKKVRNPQEYFESNFELTKQLYDAFLLSDSKIFVFMSTVKAITDKAEDIVTEEMDASPKTAYGQSKLQAEQYILSKSLPQGKRVFIIRPAMIHGPGNKGNLNLLYQLVNKGLPWPLGAFENQRSFCSIDNVCFVVQQILEQENIPSGVYNLADDEAISTNRLVELIANSKNKKSKIYKISQNNIYRLAKLGDLLKLPLNSERLEKLTENFVVSNKKILITIGKSLPVSAEVGLMKTFNSFK